MWVSTSFQEDTEEVARCWINEHFHLNLRRSEHLTQELIIENVVQEPGNKILAQSESHSIKRSSLQTLDTGRWLNDQVINYYLQVYLKNRDQETWINTVLITNHQ